MALSGLALGIGLLLVMTGDVLSAIPPAARLSYSRQGDIILGGLVPFHHTDCDAVPTMWSLQLAESVVFAIDRINGDGDLLPNVTLGFDIRDTCWNEDVSLWSALSLVRGWSPAPSQLPDFAADSPRGSAGKVVGIVGPMTSIVSMAIASVGDLYDVPMVTYGATSDELSDKDRFPYFLRTVSPDRLQAEAMVDLFSYMGWEYISIIYLADTYGIRGAHALTVLAERRGMCVALSFPVQKFPTESELDKITSELMESRKARVLVVFAELDTAVAIVTAVRDSVVEGSFTWIGSESWAHTLDLDAIGKLPPLGTVFILLNNPEPRGFYEYFSNLMRDSIEKNPWFEIFIQDWEAVHNCTVLVDERCGIPHRDLYSVSPLMSPAIDAVYAFAHALHSLINNSAATDVDGRDLLRHLKEVSFDGERGRFQFNSDGAMPGKYLLKNAQVVEGKFELATVGQWDALLPAERLTLNSKIIWGDGSTLVPASVCKETCHPGSRVFPLKEKCCFGCFACEAHEVVFNNSECIECGELEWPDETRLSCIPIVPTVPDWIKPLPLLISILSCMGLGLSAVTAFGLVWYRSYSAIKATSRELSCVNILGLLLAFVSPFLLIARPTPFTCCMSQAMVSLSFTLAYTPTLLKVCRIYRIFRAGKKSAERLKMIAPCQQLTAACLLILIQIMCVIVTSAVRPCYPQYLTHAPRDGQIELYCALGSGFLVSCFYNLALIVCCCVFAFLARRVPDNYNESKFIGASVYSTLLACLAAIPVYFTSNHASQKVVVICMAVLLNAYLTVVCLYLPKLYAIKFLTVAQSEERPVATRAHASNRVHPGPSYL